MYAHSDNIDYDGHAEFQHDFGLIDCPCCQSAEDKMQSASYWLQSMLDRIADGEGIGDEFEFDLVELCCVLGVEAPKQKIKYA